MIHNASNVKFPLQEATSSPIAEWKQGDKQQLQGTTTSGIAKENEEPEEDEDEKDKVEEDDDEDEDEDKDEDEEDDPGEVSFATPTVSSSPMTSEATLPHSPPSSSTTSQPDSTTLPTTNATSLPPTTTPENIALIPTLNITVGLSVVACLLFVAVAAFSCTFFYKRTLKTAARMRRDVEEGQQREQDNHSFYSFEL